MTGDLKWRVRHLTREHTAEQAVGGESTQPTERAGN